MSIERLERVMWRVRKKNPGQNKVSNLALKRAIMIECGTDPTTYRNNRKALKDLGWIKIHGRKCVELTNVDITGDY